MRELARLRRGRRLDQHPLSLRVHGAGTDLHVLRRLLWRAHLHQPRLQHHGLLVDGRPLQPERGLLHREQLRARSVSGGRAELLRRVRHLSRRRRLLRERDLHVRPLPAADPDVRNVETVVHRDVVLHGAHLLLRLLRLPERLPHHGSDVLGHDPLLHWPHLHERYLSRADDLVSTRRPALYRRHLLQRPHVLVRCLHDFHAHHLPRDRHDLQRHEPVLRRPLVRLWSVPVSELVVRR